MFLSELISTVVDLSYGSASPVPVQWEKEYPGLGLAVTGASVLCSNVPVPAVLPPIEECKKS